ncbi:hypothetical protein B566_EDAN007541 [Ephemera danica]|nr:hypothetical protein B566_EDAN007541 [Ephemera danica]
MFVSEFSLSKNHDYWKFAALLVSLAKENHPIRKNAFGSAKSLWGENEIDDKRVDELYEALHSFWNKHYVGSSVYVAVQSIHSLDELERMVVEYFSVIKPGNGLESENGNQNEGEILNDGEEGLVSAVATENETLNESSTGETVEGATNNNKKELPFYVEAPFDTPEFNKIYHISSISEKRVMVLSWFLPSLNKFYKNSPVKQIYYILSNNREEGLNNYLKRRLWALDVTNGAHGVSTNSKVTQVAIRIELSDDGPEHVPEILDAVFSYLRLLRRDFPQEWLFQEIQALKLMAFNFPMSHSPTDNVNNISQTMHMFAPEHYLCGTKLLLEYDPEVIRTCLNFLTPDKVNIMLSDSRPNKFYDKLIPYYGTPYAVKDIPEEILEQWKQVEPYPEFRLPLPNDYLTSDFSILPCDTCDPEAPPEKVRCDDLGELWFKQDSKFKKPKAYITLEFISPTITESLKSYTGMAILRKMLEYKFQEDFTDAMNAGMFIYLLDKNVLRIEGYTEKLPILMKNVIKNFVNIGNKEMLTPEIFQFAKEHVKKDMSSDFLDPKEVVTSVLLRTMLMNNTWTTLDCIQVLDEISFEDFIKFCQELRARMYVRALMQGNLRKEQAIDIMDMIIHEINYKPILPNTLPQLRCMQVGVGSRVCRIASLNTESSDSSVYHIFFCGPQDVSDVCFIPIEMKMSGVAFDTLRSKEALSYEVSTTYHVTLGVQFFSISVKNQEDKNSVDYVSARIWEFIQQFYHQLEAMDESEFTILCQSAMQNIQKADVTLRSEVNRNWREIHRCQYIFNRTKLQVQGHLKPVDPDTSVAENEIQDESTTDSTDSASCRTGGLKILPVTLPEGSVCNPIYDIEEYKKSLFIYPQFWS